MNPIKIEDICKDIYYLNTTKLKQWQNPQEGDTRNFRILDSETIVFIKQINIQTEGAPVRYYRCYTFLSNEWCYQGVFKGIDRFIRSNRIDTST